MIEFGCQLIKTGAVVVNLGTNEVSSVDSVNLGQNDRIWDTQKIWCVLSRFGEDTVNLGRSERSG